MRKQSRLLLCTRLVPASLLLATGAGVAAQDHGDHANMAMDVAAPAAIKRTVMKWSDASAWPTGKVPAAGEEVTIPRGTEVILDVSPPELRSLTVQGKLTFADERDLSLTTDWIYLPGGQLEIGTEDDPFEHKATITLTDKVAVAYYFDNDERHGTAGTLAADAQPEGAMAIQNVPGKKPRQCVADESLQLPGSVLGLVARFCQVPEQRLVPDQVDALAEEGGDS